MRKSSLQGSMTVEAALLFPMVFMICVVFIQLALYFVTIEYAKSVCNKGLLIGTASQSKESLEDLVTEYARQAFDEYGLIQSITEIKVQMKEFLIFSRLNIEVSGIFDGLYPIEFQVTAAGYIESPAEFCNITDLVIESISRIDYEDGYIAKWLQGE